MEEEDEYKIVCEFKLEGGDEAQEAVSQFGEGVSGLSTELDKLKEEPLKGKGKGEETEGKKDKKDEKAAIEKVSGMMSQGLVRGLKSGDVKGAMKDMGTQLATDAATSVLGSVMQSALSFIPGIGPLLGGLFGGLFQREGLVRSPTLAMVGEREPEFILTQERMRGLLSGGKPGYGFGPGDFGTPNVKKEPSRAPYACALA